MDARRLKRQRLQMDMTQAELAKETGYTQPLVSMMEAGKAPVSVRFAKALDLVRHEFVLAVHYRKAAKITGRTIEELAGQDVEGEIAKMDAEVEL